MKKIIVGLMCVGLVAATTGCGWWKIGSNEPGKKITSNAKYPKEVYATIDYSEYPENFMIKILPDTKYILKDGDKEAELTAMTHAKKKEQILYWDGQTYDISSTVYYRKTEPVFIHCNGRDYLWICEVETTGKLSSASFFFINSAGYINSDSGSVNIAIGDDILDPTDFEMETNIDCFGSVYYSANYCIGEHGKPEEKDNEDEFYYINKPYSEEELYLCDDINTWVYADSSATEATIEVVPEGTVFKRYRVPKNEEHSFVEAILEDGRVMRVVEEYWFSEPDPYQAMMDYDAKQFNYKAVE